MNTEDKIPYERLLKSEREIADRRFETLERVIEQMDIRYAERFAAQEQARSIYAENLEAWKKHANEFREQLNEERRNFMTKAMGAVVGSLTLLLLIVELFRIANK